MLMLMVVVVVVCFTSPTLELTARCTPLRSPTGVRLHRRAYPVADVLVSLFVEKKNRYWRNVGEPRGEWIMICVTPAVCTESDPKKTELAFILNGKWC